MNSWSVRCIPVATQLRFLQGQKPVLVETLIPKLAVEVLDKGVLHGLAGLDEAVARHAESPTQRSSSNDGQARFWPK